jgi:hypothetical protein
MTFRKFDAGKSVRAKGETGDCQVRSLCVARGMRYSEAWELLYKIQGERRTCGFPLVDALTEKDSRLGVIRMLSFPAEKGKPRMTGRVFCETHAKGNFILQVSNHVAAVEDGVLIDTWDCSGKCVYRAWEVRAIADEPAPKPPSLDDFHAFRKIAPRARF